MSVVGSVGTALVEVATTVSGSTEATSAKREIVTFESGHAIEWKGGMWRTFRPSIAEGMAKAGREAERMAARVAFLEAEVRRLRAALRALGYGDEL